MFFRQAIIIGVVAVEIMCSIPALSIEAKAAPLGGEAVGGAPALYSPEREFEFQPVVDGVKVIREFTVANKGSAPLLIQNVQTG